MKTQSLILVAMAALIAGCGEGFKTAQTSPEQDASSSAADTKSGSLATEAGALVWDSQSLNNQDVEYSYEMKVPFGRVYNSASRLVRWIAPRVCRSVKGLEQDATISFSANEIPCGRALDSNWRQLMAVNVDSYYSNKNKTEVAVSGFTLPIQMQRSTRRGQFSELNLDTKSNESRLSSLNFADDVSVRWIPNGQTARMELCLNLPGTTVTAPKQKVFAWAKRRVLGIKFKVSSDFYINPGSASWEFGRGCFAMDYNWQGDNVNPMISLATTKAPYLSAVSYTGLNIKIGNWFLRMLDSILGFFNASIKKKVITQLLDTGNKIADRDVESGLWFSKVHADRMLEEQGRRFNSKVMQLVKRVGSPMTSEDVKTMIQDNCRLMKLANSPQWTERLHDFCRNHVDQMEFSFEPFTVDAESKAAGCYDSFANIHGVRNSAGQKKWWADSCKFSSRFKVRMPVATQKYAKELVTLFKAQMDENRIPADWLPAMAQLEIEPGVLPLVLEELENRGFDQVTVNDLLAQAPSILEQVKQKQAQLP